MVGENPGVVHNSAAVVVDRVSVPDRPLAERPHWLMTIGRTGTTQRSMR